MLLTSGQTLVPGLYIITSSIRLLGLAQFSGIVTNWALCPGPMSLSYCRGDETIIPHPRDCPILVLIAFVSSLVEDSSQM